MKYLINFIDFWFSDFKWYRNFNINNNKEWIREEKETFFGFRESLWKKVPKGTFIMVQLMNEVIDNYPNFLTFDEQKKRTIIQYYINQYYKN